MEIMNGKEYSEWIGGIARRLKQSQIKAATAVNVEMLKFYSWGQALCLWGQTLRRFAIFM